MFLSIAICISLGSFAQKRKTVVSIKGEDFYINNKITLKGKVYQRMQLEGLLPNSRMVQGIFDDKNPNTKKIWAYPDTKQWDANRNTNEFIKEMPLWKTHGLLAFTLNLQGGSPTGYGNSQPCINSAFAADGSLDKNYMDRLERILNKADELGMVVILGYFYFGQDQHLTDEKAVIAATQNATDWVLDKGYRNVLIEVDNECDLNGNRSFSEGPYNHPILGAKRVDELITLVKNDNRNGRRLLVSTSYKGGTVPTENVLEVADFVLMHGNGVDKPEGMTDMIKNLRANTAYKKNPVIINEDDHFDFDKPINNFIAATKEHVSWGFFDYRMKDEGFEDGYQSMPANWGINSKRKKGFFELLKKMVE
ncbi:MAG: hypothetical protein JJE22_11765 [Bacteroidia bacterium]|nr:hypothetical protein [Bacteroidia bacterium]